MGVIGLAGGGEVGKALAAGHPVVVLVEAELLALGARTARVGRGDHQLRVEQLNVEPHEAEDLGEGGVKKTADEFNKEFLGEIPIDPEVGKLGDQGKPIVESNPENQISKIYLNIANKIKKDFSN